MTPVSTAHWLAFVIEIESSIGKQPTVREWWQFDRRRLISHMEGCMHVACKYEKITPVTREQIVMLIESYLSRGQA